MNFFGVGAFELALVAVVAVIVLGPERIPGVAIQLARAVKYVRGYANDATADIRKELQELTKEYDEVRKELSDFRQSVGRDVSSVASEIDRAVRQGSTATVDSGPIIEPGGEPPPGASRSGKDNGRR
jgi:sec-independent protein translocase protein TatB